MDSKGTQAYKYMYPFSSKSPSHPGCHMTLSSVPCANTVGPCWLPSLNAAECTHPSQGLPRFASSKGPACQCRRCKEMWVRSLGREDPLEEEMATHSSILAWRIPWTEEPSGLQSMGSHRVGHDLSDLRVHTHTSIPNSLTIPSLHCSSWQP